MKKIIAMLLAAVMLLGLVACAASTQEEAASATNQAEPAKEGEVSTWLCDEPTTLYIYNNWDNTATTERDQAIHDKILEITNVDIQMPDCADYYANRAVFLASDEPIDLMLESCWWATDLIGQGAYQVVDDLVATYGNNFRAVTTENTHSFVKWDGHYYGMGGTNYQNLYGIWVNKTMLDEYGLAIPTTIAEFNDTVYALKEKDPECVPLLANWMWLQRCLESSFTEGYIDWYDEEAQLLKPDFMMPGYETFATQVKTWYKDGILPDFVNPATYSDDLRQTAWMTGKAAFVCDNFVAMPTYLQQLHELYPDTEYVCIMSLEGENGRSGYEPRPSIPYFYAVPAKSENAELAMKFLDWAIGEEGWRLMNYGIEGEDYEINENGERVAISDYTGCWTMAAGVGEVYHAIPAEGTDMSEGSTNWLYEQFGSNVALAPQDTYGINLNLSSIDQSLKDAQSADATAVSEALANYMWADGTLEDFVAAKEAYAANNLEYMQARTALYQSVLDASGLTVADVRASLGK